MERYWLAFTVLATIFNAVGWWAAGNTIYAFNTGMSLVWMVNELAERIE